MKVLQAPVFLALLIKVSGTISESWVNWVVLFGEVEKSEKPSKKMATTAAAAATQFNLRRHILRWVLMLNILWRLNVIVRYPFCLCVLNECRLLISVGEMGDTRLSSIAYVWLETLPNTTS